MSLNREVRQRTFHAAAGALVAVVSFNYLGPLGVSRVKSRPCELCELNGIGRWKVKMAARKQMAPNVVDRVGR